VPEGSDIVTGTRRPRADEGDAETSAVCDDPHVADVDGWSERRVQLEGRDVFVRVGPEVPGSVPIVHVHGFAISGSSLMPAARQLASHSTSLVPDLPGHGKSADWDSVLGIPALGDAVLRFLDVMGIEKAVLLGNSMGCPVSLEAAHVAPDRVHRLVLASPAGGVHNQPLARAFTQLFRDMFREDPKQGRVAFPDYLRFGPVHAVDMFNQLIKFPSQERVLRTPVPTLAIIGTRDPLMPPAYRVREIARLAPAHVTLAVIEGAAHAMNWSHPGELAHVVSSWLDGKEIVDNPDYPGFSREIKVRRD
jgi:pimeloyl-ACP methyl ester carboxylesterase